MSNIAKWRKLSEEEFAQLVKESRSFMELARKIGYENISGSTQQTLKRVIKERNLDTSHFLGQGWKKENYDYSTFTENSYKKRGKSTLIPLIKLRGQKCEKCQCEEWLGQPINLEIHHIDGDRSNNSLKNLQLLCPNCHSYTNNFRKKSKKAIMPEEQYVEALKISKNIHQALKLLGLNPTAGNYERARKLIEQYKIEHLIKNSD